MLRGLRLARADATILRVLPVVLAKHVRELDGTDLKERARRMNLRAELGMLLELTVAGLPDGLDQAQLRKEAALSPWSRRSSSEVARTGTGGPLLGR